MQDNSINKLASYIEALRPIIYVPTFDFKAFDEILLKICDSEIMEYNEGMGYVDFKTKQEKISFSLESFLDTIYKDNSNAFLVLKDIHHSFDDPKILSLMKSIALRNMHDENFNVTIFIVSTKLIIPQELEKLITIYDTPLPRSEEIKNIIRNYTIDIDIKIDDDLLDKLSLYLKGFSEFEIIQILNLAYQNDGMINEKDISLIMEEKEQIIKKSGMIEILNYDDNIDDVGGLENLKSWLRNKSIIFKRLDEALKFKVEVPKGVLIVGMPGCGKSLTAKATATLFEIPLLRLDVGKLLGKYIGESEENMRRAVNIAEAISPCVLWIDEIEKAFAGIGSGGGHEVTTRLFGYFLTWMQEKSSSVFVVATSNDISQLPPEFLRKGRFDEIFFVDLPNEEERKSIIELHLKKRDKWSKDIDTIKLLSETEGYSGADIEAVIKDVVEKAFIKGNTKITTDDILNEIKNTKPMSVSLTEKIDGLRKELEKLDVKRASEAS